MCSVPLDCGSSSSFPAVRSVWNPLAARCADRARVSWPDRFGRGPTIGLVALMFTALLAGCSSPVTEDEFVDHALKIATSAKSDEGRAVVEKVFRCTWGAISEDESLLDEFMGTDDPGPELSAKVSALMQPCVQATRAEPGASAASTTITTSSTTVP